MLLTFDEAAHVYHLDGRKIPGVTEVLEQLTDFRFVKAEVMERARQLGRAVHKACEIVDLGQDIDPATLSPVVMPYLEGYRKFLAEVRPQWRGIEEKVCHERHRFAGTLDRRGLVFNRRAILDIKSGAETETVGLQTAAYLEAFDSANEPQWEDGTPARFALYLRDDETYRLVEIKTSRQQDFRTFLSALNLFNWRNSHAA